MWVCSGCFGFVLMVCGWLVLVLYYVRWRNVWIILRLRSFDWFAGLIVLDCAMCGFVLCTLFTLGVSFA